MPGKHNPKHIQAMAKAVNIARSHRLDGIGEYYFSRRLREIAEIEAATGS